MYRLDKTTRDKLISAARNFRCDDFRGFEEWCEWQDWYDQFVELPEDIAEALAKGDEVWVDHGYGSREELEAAWLNDAAVRKVLHELFAAVPRHFFCRNHGVCDADISFSRDGDVKLPHCPYCHEWFEPEDEVVYAVYERYHDSYETVYDTADEATRAAWDSWSHLTNSERESEEYLAAVIARVDEDGMPLDIVHELEVYIDKSDIPSATNPYAYEALRARAITAASTPEARIALFEWMRSHDMGDWNGECFDIDDGLRLYPVYEFVLNGEHTPADEYDADEDPDDIILVDAEVH